MVGHPRGDGDEDRDHRVDALVQQRHRRGRVDQVRQGFNQLLTQPRYFIINTFYFNKTIYIKNQICCKT